MNRRFTMSFIPQLDPDFKPAILEVQGFLEAVRLSNNSNTVQIALERSNGYIYTCKSRVYKDGIGKDKDNIRYIERLMKSLLWIVGGFRFYINGSPVIGQAMQQIYSHGGERDFDVKFMERVYKEKFEVVVCDKSHFPKTNEPTIAVGGNLSGCRIGFDAGGSDRKVSAVKDGKVVYSEEVVWNPKTQDDPNYHYNGILESMKTAATYLPKVDAIGVSSAGIYIDNQVAVASLFIKVPDDLFDEKVRNMYIDIAKNEFGDVPLEVANDGDVTALAGGMELNDGCVLGIAMGTSEAAGYIDKKRNLKGWLNELAFVPVDFNVDSIVDEWSGDFGCGVKYFSQDSVIKLAPKAGIQLDAKLTPAEKLKVVQNLLAQGDDRAKKIFETIGIYLGYTIAYYSLFYDIKHILILGRVTSGKGGNIIIENAKKVIASDFKALNKINITIPDEKNRRVGQSIAAASLPKLAGDK